MSGLFLMEQTYGGLFWEAGHMDGHELASACERILLYTGTRNESWCWML